MAKEHRGRKLCLHIDKTGSVLSKASNPFSASLRMELVKGKLKAEMSVSNSPYGNGNAHVTVKKEGEILYEATANYITDFFDWKEKTTELTEAQWEAILS